MVVADVPPWLIDLGKAAGVGTVVLGFFTALGKVPAARWLGRHLMLPLRWLWRAIPVTLWRSVVADPVGRWFSRLVGDVVEPISVRVASLDDRLTKHMEEEARDAVDRKARQDEADEWRATVDGRLDSIDGRLVDGDAQFAQLNRSVITALRAVGRGNPEIRDDDLPTLDEEDPHAN